MAKNNVAVLDFGSSKLTLLVGQRAVNNNFNIIASSDVDYAGFMDHEFIEEELLASNIAECISDVEDSLNRRIDKLYIGVPSEFCQVMNKQLSKTFPKKTKLTEKIIDSLFVDADDNVISNTHSVINISPLNFELDETNIVSDPIGAFCKTIIVNTCFVMADNRFISLVGRILKSLKISNVEYVCSTLAQGGYLLNDDIRNHGALFVDCGYITTTVAYFKGDGITELRSFSLGGGQITAQLSESLKEPFSVAEQVKQKLLISVRATGLDNYEVIRGNKLDQIPMVSANEIALSEIDEIIKQIKMEIETFEELPNDYETLYLTGGGLGYLKGIKFYLSRAFGRKVELLCPEPLKLRKPDLSSAISLLDASLKMEEN